MYLSQLILNLRSRDVRRDLADCHNLHRTILSAFPQAPGDASDARAHFGVLHRVETHPRSGATVLLVQSSTEPDWTRLEPGYLLDTGGDPENPACKTIDGQYSALQDGIALTFRLRANPTQKLVVRTESGERLRNGKRVALRREPDQIAWLQRRAAQGGFRILAVQANPDILDIRIIPGDKFKGQRSGAKAGDHTLTFGSVLFEGQLVITDVELFRQALNTGIGSGKAYGFGLLSIARPRS